MPVQEFFCGSLPFKVTDPMQTCFDERGYLLIRGLFSDQEITRIKSVLEDNEDIKTYAYSNKDDSNRDSRLCVWNHPGDDVTGMVARCYRVASTCEKLMSGEVYHYHSKLMMKEARTGGSFVWHQDYGYWYQNTCLFPQMMTAFISVDPCTKQNGCLQVLSGSHRCGRIEHGEVGHQIGADMERVEEIKNLCELQFVELNPGDVFFFHCNVLHTSSANTSNMRRWALLCAYNKASNSPDKEHLHPCYTPLLQVPDDSIMSCNSSWDPSGKDIITKARRDRLFNNQ